MRQLQQLQWLTTRRLRCEAELGSATRARLAGHRRSGADPRSGRSQLKILLACRLEVQTIVKQPSLASAVATDSHSAASDAGNVAAGQPGAAERRTASDMVILVRS